ncbi:MULTISPECIES: hypothetical protein [unclassified Streptomyces]|uniref:hypothetical protein n=1 Tax=unclassified Streptomyces TaxID=2593676 RepID=UPI0011E6F600|nr:hypothetical protein [Streptomyces sp. sk2.1]TXS74936.1 hypothetical protein EAO76_14620 [Streptomyces sp. sk2.1]
MEPLITLAAGALLIALGMLLIHRLNAQHNARIAVYHFSDPFPAISRPPGHSHGHHSSTGQASSRRLTDIRP